MGQEKSKLMDTQSQETRNRSVSNTPRTGSIPNTPRAASSPNTPRAEGGSVGLVEASGAGGDGVLGSSAFGSSALGSNAVAAARILSSAVGARLEVGNDYSVSGNDDSSSSDEDNGDEMILTTSKQIVTKEDFESLVVIGKGSFGKVVQVRKKDDGKIYAMKVIRKGALVALKLVGQAKTERDTNDRLYLILDYINGGELFFHLKKEGRFKESRVKFYAAEIVAVLAHLHSLHIVYRDLKPENILLDTEGHICITDFGLSNKFGTPTPTFCGTPDYLAPEILKGYASSAAADWWSLGTIVFEMLTGLVCNYLPATPPLEFASLINSQPPFYAHNVNIMYQNIISRELRFPTYISEECKSLLESLLTRDPILRLGNGGDEVKGHPWFSDIQWDKLFRKEIEPPFKPNVRSKDDTSQIEPHFTQERPGESVANGSLVSDSVQNAFSGYSYVSSQY